MSCAAHSNGESLLKQIRVGVSTAALTLGGKEEDRVGVADVCLMNTYLRTDEEAIEIIQGNAAR
jgi:hypothetical protein